MRVLEIIIGCEESQAVANEFRRLGHNAYSCDLKPCSGGHPEYHLQMDIFEALKLKKWDLGIFFPECTYIAVSGLHWNKRVPGRAEKTEQALQFVADLMNADIEFKAFENPVGCIGTRIFRYYDEETRQYSWRVFPRKLDNGARKPNQIIQPYNFGDDASKKTCLWLDKLPNLKNTSYFPPRIVDGKERWSNQTDSGQNNIPPIDDRAEIRSKTYPGIAKAMAEQWSNYILNKRNDLFSEA